MQNKLPGKFVETNILFEWIQGNLFDEIHLYQALFISFHDQYKYKSIKPILSHRYINQNGNHKVHFFELNPLSSILRNYDS